MQTEMKPKKQIKTKDLFIDVFCFLVILVYLILAGYNFSRLSRLEKYGVLGKATVDSYSLEKRWHAGKGAGHYSYTAKIGFHLADNVNQICILDFKPARDYAENEKFYILHDLESDFLLPVDEIEAFKRSKIVSKIIASTGLLIILVVLRLLDSRKTRNRSSNKRIKKLMKRDPEFKEKYKRKQEINFRIFIILIAPFAAIWYLIEKIKEKLFKKDKTKRK